MKYMTKGDDAARMKRELHRLVKYLVYNNHQRIIGLQKSVEGFNSAEYRIYYFSHTQPSQNPSRFWMYAFTVKTCWINDQLTQSEAVSTCDPDVALCVKMVQEYVINSRFGQGVLRLQPPVHMLRVDCGIDRSSGKPVPFVSETGYSPSASVFVSAHEYTVQVDLANRIVTDLFS